MNSHLLPLFISYKSSGEKLIKYQADSSCVIMSVILMTTLFYKALILQGEIWCWSPLGLKELSKLKQGPLHNTVLVLQGELNEKLLHCTYKLQIVLLHSLFYLWKISHHKKCCQCGVK